MVLELLQPVAEKNDILGVFDLNVWVSYIKEATNGSPTVYTLGAYGRAEIRSPTYIQPERTLVNTIAV